MERRDRHPLDIDLLSLATGDLESARASDLAEHVRECLLCRVRTDRIRRSGAIPDAPAEGVDHPPVSPEVLHALTNSHRPDEIERGQVWLAGETNRLLIWVRAIEAGKTLIVHPVTLDIDAVDSSALIVDEFPALAQPVAVVTSIVGTVPTDCLVSFIGDLDIRHDVDRVRDASATGIADPGLRTGAPIHGSTDERLEFRQLLADDLAALDALEDDDDDDPTEGSSDLLTAASRAMFEVLRSDLVGRRSPSCEVLPTVSFALASFARSTQCVPVALISELTCSILLITGVDRIEWALHNCSDATRLLRLANATTLAVAEPADPFDTSLFEVRDLHDAYELPRAATTTPPRIGRPARPLTKALYDFLEESVFVVEATPVLAHGGPQHVLSSFLRPHARSRVEGLRNVRAQLTKNLALKSLIEADADAVAAALEVSTDMTHLRSHIDRIAER